MTLVYAHRGASAKYPENTLLAFRRALAAGVAGLELDLHGSADGVPVVIHDRGLARTTDGSGNVDDLPLAALRLLDAGHGERIPTLDEVLRLVGDTVHFDLEIKAPGIERAVLDVLAGHPYARWAISSFDWAILREVRRVDPDAELWPLADAWSDDLLAATDELHSPAVSLFADAYTSASEAAIAGAGLRAMVWTVNAPAEARRVRDLGAWALCTDNPERLVAVLADG